MRALAHGVLGLYPFAYRRRYGEEMKALVEDSEVRVSTLADLAKGAAIAHLRPLPGLAAEAPPGDRIREARAATALAAAGLGLLLLATGGVVLLARVPGPAPDGVAFGALVAWTLLAVVAGVGCVLGARRGLFAIPIRRPGLLALVALGSLVALAMAAMALAAGVYLIGLVSDAPGAGVRPNGPLGLVSVTASLAVQLAVMPAATALASVSSLRGWRALRRPVGA